MPSQYITGLNGDPQTQSGAGLPPTGVFQAAPTAPATTTTPTGQYASNPWANPAVINYNPTSMDIPTMLQNAQYLGQHTTTAPSSSDLSYWQNAVASNPQYTNNPGYWYARMLGYEGGTPAAYGPYAAGGTGWGGYAPGPVASTGGGMGSQIPPAMASAITGINPSVWTTPYSQSPGALSVPSFDFTAPTEAQAQQYPGYEFARDQALLSMENTAAGKGLLNSSGTLFNLGGLASSLADQTYGNIWNQQYQTADETFKNKLMAQMQAANQYNDFGNNAWNKVYQALTA